MSLAQTTFGDVLDRCMAEKEATITSLRALLATATNEIEQLTTTIDEKWVEQIDALTKENKELKKENSERAALEIAFAIVKDENEVNKKNLKKMLMERPPLKSADIVPPEEKNTKNEKGNRKCVQTDYYHCAYFKIPDGVDLQDKSVVESWGTKYGTLYIKYVGKAEEEEIEWENDPSEETDYKRGNDEIVDADDFSVFYSDDEE